MIIKKIILFVLLLLLIQNNLYSQTDEIQQKKEEKKVSKGIALGAIGLCGVVIPGTYGWGNFYAKNYRGFFILNVGGSTFTILEWYFFIKKNQSATFADEFGYLILSIACLEGTLIFATFSMICGGISVKRYNEKIKKEKDFLNENKRFNYYVLPLEKGLSINITYEF